MKVIVDEDIFNPISLVMEDRYEYATVMQGLTLLTRSKRTRDVHGKAIAQQMLNELQQQFIKLR